MIIDVHAHYTFTALPAQPGWRFTFEPGGGEGARGLDSYVSTRAIQSISWRLMRRIMGIPPGLPVGPELDRLVAVFFERHLGPERCIEADLPAGASQQDLTVRGPERCIDRVVLLAFDEYRHGDGTAPLPPTRRQDRGSDIYTSNSLVRQACLRSGGRFLFGASVHPYRPNAVECVEEVFEGGACLLKWIPLHQNIDIADPRTMDVLRACARLGLPLLLHYGDEFTLATQHREYRDVSGLLDALRKLRRERAMPAVIIAHVATPVMPWTPDLDYELAAEALLGEFADAPLYADISALTAFGKARFLRPIAKRQELHSKLLFGSDFPVPLAAPSTRRLLEHVFTDTPPPEPWPEQALHLYRHLGFNEIVFHRAAEILPNVRAFHGSRTPGRIT